jgi:hypothetical protein
VQLSTADPYRKDLFQRSLPESTWNLPAKPGQSTSHIEVECRSDADLEPAVLAHWDYRLRSMKR